MKSLILGLVLLSAGCFYEPDYVTSHGTGVFGGWLVPEAWTEMALEMYAENVPSVVPDPAASPTRIRWMLSKLSIEFRDEPIWEGGAWCGGIYIVDQQHIVVHVKHGHLWSHSALYHELHHALDSLVLRVPIDFEHNDLKWFRLWELTEPLADIERTIYGSG